MTNPPSSAAALPSELGPLEEGDPARIGTFQVVGRLGAGGMGAVYGALDGSGSCVAIKVIHPRFAADPDYRERFAAEVELVRQVRATCTAAFLGADPEAEQPWLATEFVPGRTLRQHVREHGPLNGAALRAFAAGSAEALAAIHEAGIVHRDVKPANVILSPDGPKLLDFGIAKLATEPDSSGSLMGTPGWLAPEQYAGALATPFSDMFAWGGLVAVAATGRNPFGTGEVRELANRTRDSAPDLEGVPEELLPLVERAMAKDPATRPVADEAARIILGPEAAEVDESGQRRPLAPALSAVLRTAWRGFDAAGHDPGSWQALLSPAAHVGAEPAADAAREAASAISGKATTITGKATTFGVSKGVLATGAAVVTTAAVATTVVATQVIPDTSGSESPSGPDGTAPGSPQQEQEEDPERGEENLQDVEFQDVVLRIPDDWQAHETEREWFLVSAEQLPWTEEALLIQTDPRQECDLSGGEFGTDFGCEHVMVYGPGAYEAGYLGDSLDETTPYHPSTDPNSCAGQESVESDPDAAEPDSAPAPEMVEVGDQEVPHQTWSLACMDMDSSEMRDYGQRVWYLEDAGVLVVDEWGTEDLDEALVQTAYE